MPNFDITFLSAYLMHTNEHTAKRKPSPRPISLRTHFFEATLKITCHSPPNSDFPASKCPIFHKVILKKQNRETHQKPIQSILLEKCYLVTYSLF